MRPIRVLLAVSAAALVAAACGGDPPASSAAPAGRTGAPAATSPAADAASLSGEEILARAKAAFKAAKSVHVIGNGTSGQGKTAFKVDMRYTADGRAIGSVTNSGQQVELRRIGQVLYIKASKAFWTATSGAAAGTQFGGRYLKIPLTDQRIAGISALTDKGAFIDAALTTTTGVAKGSVRTVDGTRAIPLTTKDATAGGTLFVAASGLPLPLSVLPPPGSKDIGKVSFVDYGAPVTVAAPPAAETVDAPAAPGR